MTVTQSVKDCGRSVKLETFFAATNTPTFEMAAIVGLIDSLTERNLGNAVDANLFLARHCMVEAIKETR